MRSVKFFFAAGAASLLSTVALRRRHARICPPAACTRRRRPARFRRLVSARRCRHDQSESQVTSIRQLSRPRHYRSSRRSASALTPQMCRTRCSAISSTTGSAPTSPANTAARPTSTVSTFTDFLAGSALELTNYHGTKSETVMLANGYVDLGTWWCVTPFIGAGLGTSSTQIRFRDDASQDIRCRATAGFVYAADSVEMGLRVGGACRCRLQGSPNVTLEFAYSYVDLGDAVLLARITNFTGFTTPPFTFS